MNKQPYYHSVEFWRLTGDEQKSIVDGIKRIKGVIKSSVEVSNGEVLFTATGDMVAETERLIAKVIGDKTKIVGPVECEPGDPADLM